MKHGRARARVFHRGRWRCPPGDFDSDESRAADDDVVREWRRDREAPDGRRSSVAEFALLYVEHAERRSVTGGEPTSEIFNVRTVLRWAVKLFRCLPLRDLHAGHVETFQRELAVPGVIHPATINRHTARLRRAIRWGVARRLIPTDVLVSIEAAEPLRRRQAADVGGDRASGSPPPEGIFARPR